MRNTKLSELTVIWRKLARLMLRGRPTPIQQVEGMVLVKFFSISYRQKIACCQESLQWTFQK